MKKEDLPEEIETVMDAIGIIYQVAEENKSIWKNLAKLHRTAYLEFLNAGFTEEQAMQLTVGIGDKITKIDK